MCKSIKKLQQSDGVKVLETYTHLISAEKNLIDFNKHPKGLITLWVF